MVFPIAQRPEFPDRTAIVFEQRRQEEEARKAARKAEEERQALLAAQRARTAYTASPVPTVAVTGDCHSWMAAAGIVDQVSAYQLILRESGCNPNARNASSGACGIGQQLPCGKWPHVWNDPVGAMIDMQAYVFGRYGSWANALAHSLANNWY